MLNDRILDNLLLVMCCGPGGIIFIPGYLFRKILFEGLPRNDSQNQIPDQTEDVGCEE
jgi:hypothetical protein